MPLRYDDLSASQAFLKATMAVNDLTTDLHKHHGAVRDFMREILSSVSYSPALQSCLYLLQIIAEQPQYLVRLDVTQAHEPDVRRTRCLSFQENCREVTVLAGQCLASLASQ